MANVCTDKFVKERWQLNSLDEVMIVKQENLLKLCYSNKHTLPVFL
jgi:hypothetical protein